ncbi:hypothetical protein CEXT_176111 [Caerostris extrusa]|uniref:Uncharacterized protein n=1 Tax=Caerostris extrusa TaxID=172846 RepID=A0AAV4NZE1_CAEEX|nr:hypothetical protein CEXT_176111 [Caerostris extrusa]
MQWDAIHWKITATVIGSFCTIVIGKDKQFVMCGFNTLAYKEVLGPLGDEKRNSSRVLKQETSNIPDMSR